MPISTWVRSYAGRFTSRGTRARLTWDKKSIMLLGLGQASKRDARFPDGDLALVIELVAGRLAGSSVDDEIHQLGFGLIHARAFQHLAGVEIDPAWLLLRERGVGGNLEGGHRESQRCPAAGGKQKQSSPGGDQRGGGNSIIARRFQQRKSRLVGALTVEQHLAHGCAATF